MSAPNNPIRRVILLAQYALWSAVLPLIDPEAAATLKAEHRRGSATPQSAEYLAHRKHVQAVEESLKTFGAPVPQKPSAEPLPEHLREQMHKRIRFVPEGSE